MPNNDFKYCNDPAKYSRLNTREVFIGEIPLGNGNPIRIQSMTTTDTMDTIATVEQSIRMVKSGCDYVRITAPSINEAENLLNIKNELRAKGFDVPLIADIHFTPNAAETAARIVEKVRINPGNYVDKKKFKKIEYTDSEYAGEIDRIRDRFTPLVMICKEYGTAMRIGTNHGSLSDRIMSRYGDTPMGMVESALEFVRICEDLDFHNIVLSMKSSSTRVMIQAYRLLVHMMFESGNIYPLHLGVTEAGDGIDGRIKSALGIGALLEDGLGDTIRVSLTEPPENEAPVASEIIRRFTNRAHHEPINPITDIPVNPFSYSKRESFETEGIGGANAIKVVADLSRVKLTKPEQLEPAGYHYSAELDKWNFDETAADILFLGDNTIEFNLPPSTTLVVNSMTWQKSKCPDNLFPLFTFEEYQSAQNKSRKCNFVRLTLENLLDPGMENFSDSAVVFIAETSNLHGLAEQRQLFFNLIERKINNPVIINRRYDKMNNDRFALYAATDFGGLLNDGFGDGVWAVIDRTDAISEPEKIKIVNKTLFGILQAARVRISKTEYIACPSCGRTLFDLVDVTNKIRKMTGHLKGLKIGIMGCIVNGPGEMADADYGYVGSGPGIISLYKGKEIVKKNIPSDVAVDELIALIKENDDWAAPPISTEPE